MRTGLEVWYVREHRFDVNDRRSVDSFDWADTQLVPDDLVYSDAMEPQRVWPVGRSGCEDTGEWAARVGARVDLQDIAPCFVQPSNKNDVAADRESVKPSSCECLHFQPGIGGTFRSLHGRFAARLEDGSDHTNRTKPRITFASLHTFPS